MENMKTLIVIPARYASTRFPGKPLARLGGESIIGRVWHTAAMMAGAGLLSCLLGLFYAAKKKMSDNPSRELNLSTWISAGLTVVDTATSEMCGQVIYPASRNAAKDMTWWSTYRATSPSWSSAR